MELVNATRMQAGYTLSIDGEGREHLLVVIKGSFRLPRDGEALALCAEQAPLVLADEYEGAPGLSAPLREADFVPSKPRSEVLCIGSAWSPGGRPAERVPVGIRVGHWSKGFTVVGDRSWQVGRDAIRASAPQPFVTRRISYGVAFGGVDAAHPDPAEHRAFLRNPVGLGFAHRLERGWLDGRPLPATEALDAPVERPDADYAPMSFGPLGRAWSPRAALAGTYDERWLDTRSPFLPEDFDAAYFQSAPPDQQIDGPLEGQQVVLVNLTPDGHRSFTLPAFEATVQVFPRRGTVERHVARLDTLVLEPDAERFTLTWRVLRPLKRNIFEVAQVMVGRKGPEWWQQRERLPFPLPVVMVPMTDRERAGTPS